jgi:hypothetical protein
MEKIKLMKDKGKLVQNKDGSFDF